MQALLAITPIFMIMLLGWFLKFKGIMNNEFVRNLNFIIYWVALPALFFQMMLKCDISSIKDVALVKALYFSFLVTPILVWILGLIRWKFLAFPEVRIPVSVMSSIRSNNIFMGMPVVTLLLGDPGLESLGIYLALGMAGYHIFSIGMGQAAMSKKFGFAQLFNTILNLLKNPLILSMAAGILLSLTGFCQAPSFLDKFLEILGKTASGMALLALGASFKHERLFVALKETWFDALLKLVLSPLIVWLAFLLWPTGPVMMKTVVLVCAMPVAVNTFAVSQGMGMDSEYASEVITTSTLLSLLTIPLWSMVLGVV